MNLKNRMDVFEVYIDEEDDVHLAIRKLNFLLSQINKKRERVVLVVMDELKHPEQEEITG